MLCPSLARGRQPPCRVSPTAPEAKTAPSYALRAPSPAKRAREKHLSSLCFYYADSVRAVSASMLTHVMGRLGCQPQHVGGVGVGTPTYIVKTYAIERFLLGAARALRLQPETGRVCRSQWSKSLLIFSQAPWLPSLLLILFRWAVKARTMSFLTSGLSPQRRLSCWA